MFMAYKLKSRNITILIKTVPSLYWWQFKVYEPICEHTKYCTYAKFYHYTVVTVFRIMCKLDTTRRLSTTNTHQYFPSHTCVSMWKISKCWLVDIILNILSLKLTTQLVGLQTRIITNYVGYFHVHFLPILFCIM